MVVIVNLADYMQEILKNKNKMRLPEDDFSSSEQDKMVVPVDLVLIRSMQRKHCNSLKRLPHIVKRSPRWEQPPRKLQSLVRDGYSVLVTGNIKRPAEYFAFMALLIKKVPDPRFRASNLKMGI